MQQFYALLFVVVYCFVVSEVDSGIVYVGHVGGVGA